MCCLVPEKRETIKKEMASAHLHICYTVVQVVVSVPETLQVGCTSSSLKYEKGINM